MADGGWRWSGLTDSSDVCMQSNLGESKLLCDRSKLRHHHHYHSAAHRTVAHVLEGSNPDCPRSAEEGRDSHAKNHMRILGA